jgi:hypothetical protein
MAAPVDEALQLAYPDVYDLADSSGPWGSQEQGKVRGTQQERLLREHT